MSVRSILYDVKGTDRKVDLSTQIVAELNESQLLWIDLSEYSDDELNEVAVLLGLKRESLYTIMQQEHRPRLDHYGAYSQLNINTIEEVAGKYKLVEVDFILSANLIVTLHHQPVAFLHSFDQRVKADSDLGILDAPAFLAVLLDWHVTTYFRLVEDLERAVDKIDAHALRPRHTRDLLTELARLRQRVGFIRRVLTPHREVYAAMSRPDFLAVANSASTAHFRILADRLTRAIEAVENARELLVGSYDMFTTQTTLRTNEVIKVLTLSSFIWFPASVIVGIAAMLLKSPVDPATTPGFWAMIGLIIVIFVLTLSVARWRRWI